VKEETMQTENRFFDDLAKVATGAFHTLGGLKDEVESRFRERLERLANEMDLVTREELDAVKAMAAKARTEQERLEERVVALETRIAELERGGDAAPARRSSRKAPAADDTTG
jgi:BMFP domain-containing protein YqiC